MSLNAKTPKKGINILNTEEIKRKLSKSHFQTIMFKFGGYQLIIR